MRTGENVRLQQACGGNNVSRPIHTHRQRRGETENERRVRDGAGDGDKERNGEKAK